MTLDSLVGHISEEDQTHILVHLQTYVWDDIDPWKTEIAFKWKTEVIALRSNVFLQKPRQMVSCLFYYSLFDSRILLLSHIVVLQQNCKI